MATLIDDGNGGERVMGSEEPIEDVAERFEDEIRTVRQAGTPSKNLGQYMLDQHRLAHWALARLASDRALEAMSHSDDRTEAEIAEHIVAAIEYSEPLSGRQWRLRDGFNLGLREQYTLASKVSSRLISDRDEAAERSKPIDEEFVIATLGGSMSFKADALDGATVTVWATRLSPSGFELGIAHGDTEYVHNLTITTRGQLLDLIRALKGGAT